MLTLLVLISFISFAFIYLNGKKSSKGPPGPLRLPIIGGAWALGTNPFIIHATLTNLAEKYGPIYRVMIGDTPLVVLSSPELIREAFNGADPPVLLRYTGKSQTLASSRGESIFTTKDRNYWALMRRMCSPMTRTIITPMPQLIDEEKTKLFVEIDKYVNKDVHLNPLFMMFTRNVFLRIFLGKSWSYDDVTSEQIRFADCLIEGLKKGMIMHELIPAVAFIRKFSGKAVNDTVESFAFTYDFIRKMIEERRAENRTSSLESAQDLLDILLLEQKEHPEVSDASLIATIRAIFVAASATSADTLDWLLLFLCTYPDIQEKCYKEIKEKLNGRAVTIEDQQNLPYLDNVIKETFRLRPAAPVAVSRVAERDCVVGGYAIEKGTIVIENLYGIGNLETYYKNHATFDPDRWLRNPEKSADLLHFGAGPTICLGMNVARQEVFLTAASLLQKYKFSISPTSPKPDFIGEFKVVFNPKVWHTAISLR